MLGTPTVPHDPDLLQDIFDRISPEPNSGCWLWIQNVSRSGYGRTDLRNKRNQAHRLSWYAKHGPIPPGLEVCHKCDVRICVNPDHLWVGTHKENMRDMARKNRAWKSEPERAQVHARKLNREAVERIRADGRRHWQIALDYGVDRSHVSAIKRGDAWRLGAAR